MGSSRGALTISILELHKDEEIYFLVGQKGEHACIKSMGYRDKECEPKDHELADQLRNSKTKQVRNMIIEDGAGGGGGATYVYVRNSANDVVPLVVAAGGGGLGIGRYLDDYDQHGRDIDPSRIDVSGQTVGEMNKTGGPGGGWRAHADYALGINVGASLLAGGRGGEPCYPPRGIHGNNVKMNNLCHRQMIILFQVKVVLVAVEEAAILEVVVEVTLEEILELIKRMVMEEHRTFRRNEVYPN